MNKTTNISIVCNRNFCLKGFFFAFVATFLCTTTFAQTPAQSAAVNPVIPDSRKPNRAIQPSATGSATATAPAQKAEATTWASEARFSQSTQFTFKMEPANHPRMPSNDKLMQTSVTLYKNGSADGSSFSGSPTFL